MNTTIEKGSKNALEALLYPPRLPRNVNIDTPTKSKTKQHLADNYENGMLISISNNKTYWEDLIRQYRRQYQSIIFALTGKKISRDDITQLSRIPKRETISNLVYYKIPIVVAGIHDYHKGSELSKGSFRNYDYQHTHFYVYNTHHYLPSNKKQLNAIIKKLEKTLLRYTNSKNGARDIVRISPVGVGKFCYTDNINPTDVYEYLTIPQHSPNKECLINYIATNRHKPEITYPLNTIYYRKNQL